MTATLSQIKGWLEEAKEEEATHMIVVCSGFGDPFGDCCEPVFVKDNDPRKAQYLQNGRIMEVYSLTGKYSVENQLKESRAFHYD